MNRIAVVAVALLAASSPAAWAVGGIFPGQDSSVAQWSTPIAMPFEGPLRSCDASGLGDSAQADAEQAGLRRSVAPASSDGHFALRGLISPAVVADSIYVYAAGVPASATVTYYLDSRQRMTESRAPFWMGHQENGVPAGFSLDGITPGEHELKATAMLPNGKVLCSSPITLKVIPSLNPKFSRGLTPYPHEISAQRSSLDEILKNTTTPGAELTRAELATRKHVLAMYINWGIDPSIDNQHDESQILLSLAPRNWAPSRRKASSAPLSMLFSPDAPYYHAIPAAWPRVALPRGYIQHIQLNTNRQGDGIGFGEVVASPTDKALEVRSEWYWNAATLKTFTFRMPQNWPKYLPTQRAGDMHMILVDPRNSTFISSYKTSQNPSTGGLQALYSSSPTALGTLGDRGGSIAAGFAELPVMLQPGEATNPNKPIQHAIGGPVGRTWAARVFPASAWDAGVKGSRNSCTGTGFTNTGLVPYGGVIQLDPKLDLNSLQLSLPALRILQAMQTYGYYVMDFGCADLDIYTAIPEAELEPFGGLWGYNRKGVGVQNEIQNVLANKTLYVVAPLTKKK